MMPVTEREFLPVELILNPNWWNHATGISFDESFYLDAETRIQNDLIMRRVLHQRFGDMGLGEAHPQPRPVVGSPYVAGASLYRRWLVYGNEPGTIFDAIRK